jgi:DNA-binding XRE family transcriptional regulator
MREMQNGETSFLHLAFLTQRFCVCRRPPTFALFLQIHTHGGPMRAEELRTRRLALGLSRNRLAAEVGVQPDAVSQWEEGDVPIECPHAVEQVLKSLELERDRVNTNEIDSSAA